MKRLSVTLIAVLFLWVKSPVAENNSQTGHYENFKVAIYVVVNDVRQLADRSTFEHQFERVMRQIKFDKVYLEVYRNTVFATDEEIEKVKRYFADKGVDIAGGITPAAGGSGGQFGTFDYENPSDRAECKKAAERAARHFNEVILDDFFFYTSKSDADIAARAGPNIVCRKCARRQKT